MTELVQTPKIKHHAGATPKLTKSARLSSSAPNFDDALEHAGDAAVDAVKHRGENDRRHGPFELLSTPAGSRSAGAQREQGDEVRHQMCAPE